MKHIVIIILSLFLSLSLARASVINFDLSPAGTDSAAGLSPLNEVPTAANSSGSGNEINSGITFDTDTLTLNLDIGYGSAFGFSDLTGAANAMHIHGPAPTNTPAPIVLDLAALHVAASNAAAGGSIVGSLVLTADQADALLAGLYFVNIHTEAYSAGEIRGQLVPVNVLPVVLCPAVTNLECAGPEGTFAFLAAQVADEDGDVLTVVWSVNGTPIQTNTVAAGTSTNLSQVGFEALYQTGTNTVAVTVSDGIDTVTCGTAVIVIDTLPPVIIDISVSPNELWPPNHKLRPVVVSVTATDQCEGTPLCRITSIGSDEPDVPKGKSKKSSPDWVITGGLTAKLRAERLGQGDGRVYMLNIECADSSGNTTNAQVIVTVPHDRSQLAKSKKNNKPTATPKPKEPKPKKNK